MIFDSLEKAKSYGAVHPLLTAAAAFLTGPGLTDLPDGRHELADGAYASVQTYDSKPLDEGSYETHRRYVDVQCLIEGEEWIYVSTTDALIETTPYRPEDDCTLFRGSPTSRILMRPGYFLLLFPQDAHMPCVTVANPARVKKVVVKLPL